MNKIDYLDLDGHNLKAFLTVLNELSVSKAAEQLEVTQSSVSHTLDKLRLSLCDALFVRSGRGIAPTERAISLRKPVQDILDNLKELTNDRVFDPASELLNFTVAANDFQRDLIFPDILHGLLAEGINAHFNFIPSGIPTPDMLRENKCQFIVTPFPPQETDIHQAKLFEDKLVCFYDSKARQPPKNKKDFLSSNFIEVKFTNKQSDLETLSKINSFTPPKAQISVSNFNAIPLLLQNTDMLCVAIRLMKTNILKSFSSATLPFKSSKLTVYLLWHSRDHRDPAHKWLRDKIKKQCDYLKKETATL